MILNDEFFMNIAIDCAWKYQGLTYPNPAVGCVIVGKNGEILGIGAHKKAGYAHAEVCAVFKAIANSNKSVCKNILSNFFTCFLRSTQDKEDKNSFSNHKTHIDEVVCSLVKKAISFYDNPKSIKIEDDFYIYGKEKNDFNTLVELENLLFSNPLNLYESIIKFSNDIDLKNASAYVTLEPCSHTGRTPPCANLLISLGIKRVIIGSLDPHSIASGGANLLKEAGIDIKAGVCKDRADKLLEPFLAWQLGSGFCFAKLAISANGVVDGSISCELSRTHMHALRTRLSALAIGGGTVRADNPRLDSRLINGGKAPDIVIFTRSDINKDISLFHIENRSVSIQNNPNVFDKFVMYEGAYGLFDLISSGYIKHIKWVLLYQSPYFKECDNIKFNLALKPLWRMNMGSDILGWYEIIRD